MVQMLSYRPTHQPNGASMSISQNPEQPASRNNLAGISALSSRAPGYAVAQKCLEVQAAAESANPTLRGANRVRLDDSAWPWYVGALGEREVGKALARLDASWFIRHAVPIGAGTKDVDHLVIGPGGVFMINSKHHRDTSVWIGDSGLRINNHPKRHLADAERDARDVSERLSTKVGFDVPVVPVVAIVGARSLTDRRAVTNRAVNVVAAPLLIRWLRSRGHRLSPAELGLVWLAAEEPDTWHTDPHAADTMRVMQRFDRLVADVGLHPAKPAQLSPPRNPQSVSSPRVRPTTRPVTTGRSPAARLVLGVLAIVGSIAGLHIAIQLFTAFIAGSIAP
jgi:hypothetical protein